jgi:Domain of unknown function (DUF4158)
VTRLGFALLLKFYEVEGRFPAFLEEVPRVAVDYMASLVKVDPALFAKYSWRTDDRVSPGADPQGVRDAAAD